MATDAPYESFYSGLKGTIGAMNVTLVKDQHQAPYGLYITNSRTSVSQPNIVDTSVAATLSSSFSTTVTIKDNQCNTILGPINFSGSASQTMSANQVLTASVTASMETQMRQQTMDRILIWLMSGQVRETFNAPTKNTPNSAPSNPTPPASSVKPNMATSLCIPPSSLSKMQ